MFLKTFKKLLALKTFIKDQFLMVLWIK